MKFTTATYGLLPLIAATMLSCQSKIQSKRSKADEDKIWHYSVMDAMRYGIYHGDQTIDSIKNNGDFGLGTFNLLEGEMVALNGKFYRIETSGKVVEVDGTARTPFASLAFFKPDSIINFQFTGDFEGLKTAIQQKIPSANLPYAVKVETIWQSLLVGGAKKLDPADTTGLGTLMKTRPAYPAKNIGGTLIGFYNPGYMSSVDLSPFHFHFLSVDESYGGHVMQGSLVKANVKLFLDEKVGYDINLLHNNKRFRDVPFDGAGKSTY